MTAARSHGVSVTGRRGSRRMCHLGCVAAASWPTFRRLESIDGPGAQIEAPQWFSAAARPGADHPVWALVKKELHLQQMTFIVVLIYIAGWAALSIAGRGNPDLEDVVIPLTIIYLGLLSILIGSLASAEERQFGTIEWQMLAPTAAWRQWAVKAGVAIGLALLLGGALPVVLNLIHIGGLDSRATDIGRGTMVVVVLITVSSLYVASRLRNGIKPVTSGRPQYRADPAGVAYVVNWVLFATRILSPIARCWG